VFSSQEYPFSLTPVCPATVIGDSVPGGVGGSSLLNSFKPDEKPVIEPPPEEVPAPVSDNIPDEHPTPPPMEMPALGNLTPPVEEAPSETPTPEAPAAPPEMAPPNLYQNPPANLDQPTGDVQSGAPMQENATLPTTPEVTINPAPISPPSGGFPWKIVAIITTILALISISVVAFLALQNSQLSEVPATETDTVMEEESTNADADPPADSPPPADDPTANWDTYSNAEHGFTFMHPNLNECCAIAAASSKNKPEEIVTMADATAQTFPSSGTPFNGFTVEVIPNLTGLTFQLIVESEKQNLIAALKEFNNEEPPTPPGT